ncbi:hypothetical protein [Bradyrhizobium sp. RDM4]|uniref:hypothetical protein n=1 Tax=Bradyrhizobium sp. RDM4 TaxID=3378765 RepID=UPI0038FC37F2
MTAYTLNKMLREVNRNPGTRQRYMADAESVAADYELSEEERQAFVHNDVGALYRLGAHGLILRPFTLLRQMPEPEYLRSIRGE